MRAGLVNHVSAIALAAVAAVGIATASNSAHAASIVFTFDDVKNASGQTVVSGIADGATNSTIQTYMNNVIDLTNVAWGVTVYNTSTMGAAGERNYTGDNHVVGLTVGTGYNLPTTPASCASKAYNCGGTTYQMLYNNVVPLTLGNTDGFVESNSSGLNQLLNANAYSSTGVVGHLTTLDSYIVNDTSTNPDKTTIGLAFTGGLTISKVEFDFEIFPDSTCATSSCGSLPDLTLKYKDENGVMHTVQQFLGETPDGDTHSPLSGRSGTELTPQLLSHASFVLPSSAVEIYFQDWPVMIGVDNLVLETTPPRSNAPEPMTGALLLSGLGGMWFARRRRARRAAA
jgi:hypothetical protein